jgi:hypothetical protein
MEGVAHLAASEETRMHDMASAWRDFGSSRSWSTCAESHKSALPSHLEELRDRQILVCQAEVALAQSRLDLALVTRQFEGEGPGAKRLIARLEPYGLQVAAAAARLISAEAAAQAPTADDAWLASERTMRVLRVAVEAGFGEELRPCRGVDRAARRDEVFWRSDINKLHDRRRSARDPDAKTLLMKAASLGDYCAALRLISLGAKVDARDNRGCTALHHAVHSASADTGKVARVLLSHGANVDAKDDGGHSALSHAAGAAGWTEYEPSDRDSDGFISSSSAYRLWSTEDSKDLANVELAAVLLQHGADPTGIKSPLGGRNKYTPTKRWRVESIMRTFEAERARARHDQAARERAAREAREYEERELGADALAYLGALS